MSHRVPITFFGTNETECREDGNYENEEEGDDVKVVDYRERV